MLWRLQELRRCGPLLLPLCRQHLLLLLLLLPLCGMPVALRGWRQPCVQTPLSCRRPDAAAAFLQVLQQRQPPEAFGSAGLPGCCPRKGRLLAPAGAAEGTPPRSSRSSGAAFQKVLRGGIVPSERFRMKRCESEAADAAPPGEGGRQQKKGPEEPLVKTERQMRSKKSGEKNAETKKTQQEDERKAVAAALLLREAKDFETDDFGYWPLIQSQQQPKPPRVWSKVGSLDSKEGQNVWTRARLQDSRCKGSLAFLILREGVDTVQCVFGPSCSRDLLKWVASVPLESLVDVQGLVVSPHVPITNTSIKSEVQGAKVFCVAKAPKELPFQLRDASRPEDDRDAEGVLRVHLDTRLEHRCLDLRVASTFAIQRALGSVCKAFRDFLFERGFTEIHTPKIIPSASEGGASCFTVPYFNKMAYLAQSPQLYKQMCICGDMDRVFEIGPVFRAENSNTHRHLCEFVGLDLEMTIKEDFSEALELIEQLLKSIFQEIETGAKNESETIRRQFQIPPFKYLPETPRLQFSEAVQLLRDAGYGKDEIPEDLKDFDLSTELERALGKIVEEKYKSDFFFLCRYPSNVRPFYSMPDPDDPNFSNTFDIFMRGEEIASGAQRIHDAQMLRQRCAELGLPEQQLKPYIDAMALGAPPHAGVGIGLERVIMQYFGLGNIRRVSLFPRDPKRLSP